MLLRMLGVNSVDPRAIKALIPASWFTRRGPGVHADAIRAFRAMSPEQLSVARARGWLSNELTRVNKKGELRCSRK